jgi:hypothetical protein
MEKLIQYKHDILNSDGQQFHRNKQNEQLDRLSASCKSHTLIQGAYLSMKKILIATTTKLQSLGG